MVSRASGNKMKSQYKNKRCGLCLSNQTKAFHIIKERLISLKLHGVDHGDKHI